MSEIWPQLINIENYYINKFNETSTQLDQYNIPNWTSRSWQSPNYRLANIVTADLRESKNIWMMHCCVFPHLHNPAPIFGFDVIAGKNKITGCFHDFSPAGDSEHPLIEWFAEQDGAYRQSLLPKSALKVSIEAGIAQGWREYVGDNGVIISLDHFGASASAAKLFEEFGFGADAVVAKIKAAL